ncbi:MAG: glycosyltransferase family 9 protein [Pseudomonadales bacterium]
MELRQARNLLVCLRWGIGDVVMELPLLQALRQSVPAARITALGANPAVELLRGEGVVDAVQAVQTFGISHWGDAGCAAARAEIVGWCRRAGFDYVLDSSHAPQGVQMALWEVALPGRDTGCFDAAAASVRHLDGCARLAAAGRSTWGVDVDATACPQLHLGAPEHRAARALRTALAPPSMPLIGVAPIASSHLKRGAVAQFSAVADTLLAAVDARVTVFAGDQQPLAEAMVATMQQPHRARVVPVMDLRSTAALLAQCRVLVCNDTGLMHLAAAVGTPVVAVFACTSPRLYLPRGGTAVQRWDYPCSHVVHDDFGVAPCVARNRCVDPEHGRRNRERWAGAAAAAALRHL